MLSTIPFSSEKSHSYIYTRDFALSHTHTTQLADQLKRLLSCVRKDLLSLTPLSCTPSLPS